MSHGFQKNRDRFQIISCYILASVWDYTTLTKSMFRPKFRPPKARCTTSDHIYLI